MIQFLFEAWNVTAEMGPYLLLGFVIAGLLRAFISPAWVEKHLGSRGFGQVFKATLLGVPLPLCSCGVIPVALGLRRQGGSPGAVAAFAASTPQTGVDSIFATAGMMGWLFSGIRVVAAFASGFLAGVSVQALSRHRNLTEDPDPVGASTDDGEHACCGSSSSASATEAEESCCTSETEAGFSSESESSNTHKTETAEHGCCHSQESAGLPAASSCCSKPEPKEEPASCCSTSAQPASPNPPRQNLKSGLRFGLITLPSDIAGALVFGILIAAVLTVFVPASWITSWASNPALAFGAVSLLSVPLYVCSVGSIPMAFALVQGGLSPGAALVFLIVGPATNAATVAALKTALGLRATIAYLVSILLTAWIAGALVDSFKLQITGAMLDHHHAGLALWQQFGGAGLILLLAFAWIQEDRGPGRPSQQPKVEASPHQSPAA